jgi:hypothetical protein
MSVGIHRPRQSVARLTPNGGNRLVLAGGRRTGGGATGGQFIGPAIGTINGTTGSPIGVVSTSARFSFPPGAVIHYSQGGAWPSWATIGAASGQIGGTPPGPGTTGPATVIATADGGGSAQSNAFQFVIA